MANFKPGFKILAPLVFVISTAAGTFICPPYSEIRPCFCSVLGPLTTLKCKFNGTNNQLTRVFDHLRVANGLNSSSVLTMNVFELFDKSLTFLDWSPFANLRVDELVIFGSRNIRSYDGPPANFGLIQVQKLFLGFNDITESRLGDSLKQFSPEMRELSLDINQFTGLSQITKVKDQKGHVEFLPGLGNLVNLQEISLELNNIQKLSHGPFYTNNRLERLFLRANELEEIGPDGLLLAPPPGELNETRILIDLQWNNNLGEAGFSPDSGVDRLGRSVYLDLTYCNFTTLPQPTFEKFLRAHPDNGLDLNGNPIACDESTDWLREPENVEKFKSRVVGGNCQNSPGETIFTWKKPGKMFHPLGKFGINFW